MAKYVVFPVPLPTQWSIADSNTPLITSTSVKDWVTTDSSLTARVQELGASFSLDVLNQTTQHLPKSWQQILGVQDISALFREVLLKQKNTPLIYAQTIIPESSVTGTEAILSHLGNKPLGQVLFQSSKAVRGDIEFAKVMPNSPLANFIENTLSQPIIDACYIRRSKFHLNQKPLLVCECFLPSLFTINR